MFNIDVLPDHGQRLFLNCSNPKLALKQLPGHQLLSISIEIEFDLDHYQKMGIRNICNNINILYKSFHPSKFQPKIETTTLAIEHQSIFFDYYRFLPHVSTKFPFSCENLFYCFLILVS